MTAMLGPSGKGIVKVGHPAVCRDVFRAWHFKHFRGHHRVQMLYRSISRNVRAYVGCARFPGGRKLWNGKPS